MDPVPPMPIPAFVVSTARSTWHWQWQQLMGGLAPADEQGNYRRPPSPFCSAPALPAAAEVPGRFALIVGRSCPWAHRAWLVWALRGLADNLDVVVVEPDPQAGRWVFSSPFEGCQTLAELYARSGAADRRATVPVLVDREERRIVLGESARLIELLNLWPAPPAARDLAPDDRAPSICHWRELLQDAVNDGVYRCGFARNQAAYDRAEQSLFLVLDQAEQTLSGTPWLCGQEPTLADVQLFPTLIRMELVYAPLFGVSRRPLWQFPSLWEWRSRFWRLPGVADTCFDEAWRRDYFGALFPLHPSAIVPAGPPLATLVAAAPAAARP
ncbi:MAG: glutathione S-transferase C-terminal domain-containing protein [Cyanobacteriota bacterium]|nr:glutathione S-transferase C-terminal domain-containing protein [Cyanobacteriota bacterium]